MSNVRKACGKPVGEVFQFLILLAFQGKNLFRFLNSNHAAQAGAQKNTFYRFMSDPSYNWKKFLLLLAAKVINNLHPLTKQSRVKVFILDDSTIARNRSKKVELLARIFDHVSHKFVKGFTLLTLGWSDGYSFIPLAFNLLSSAKDSNRYQEISASIDHRTNGYKARLESMLHKPDATRCVCSKMPWRPVYVRTMFSWIPGLPQSHSLIQSKTWVWMSLAWSSN